MVLLGYFHAGWDRAVYHMECHAQYMMPIREF